MPDVIQRDRAGHHAGNAQRLIVVDGKRCIDKVKDLRCVYNNASELSCENTRNLLEQAVVRQLYEACGGTQCSESNFVKYLAGPPFDVWGIQTWYQAGNPAGEPNLESLVVGAIGDYRFLEDNAVVQLNNPNLTVGCGGFACSWGNPVSQPPPPAYYASYIDPAATYGVFNGRVYFIIGA